MLRLRTLLGRGRCNSNACLFSLFVRRSRSDCDAKKGRWLHHRADWRPI
jgi:hypothetical protein